MKKKITQVLLGVVLGAAFLGAVAFGINKTMSTEEETTKKEKNLNPKIPEALSAYQMGEEVEVGDFLWQVSQAKIIESYEELDDYYKSRGYLKAAEPNQQNPFAKELKYLWVEFSMKNTSEKEKSFNPCAVEFANDRGEGLFERWGMSEGGYWIDGEFYSGYDGYNQTLIRGQKNIDGKYTLENSTALTEFQDRKEISLSPGETIHEEFVLQFYEYRNKDNAYYIYDLCMKATGADAERPQYISLNIAPKHLDITKTTPENTYDEQRDIAEMKCGQIINLDMKQYQETGYPIPYEYDNDSSRPVPGDRIVEENFLTGYDGLRAQIQKSEIVEWKDIPEVFAEQGYLKKMAERYQKDYGYSEEELKVLLLDISYVQKYYDVYSFCIYDYTWLFTRDSNGKRWVFGTADDWTVLSNDENPQRTGHINTEWMNEGTSMLVQAAYILPPEILEKEDALYFCRGEYYEHSCDWTAEIKLK